MSTSTRRVYDAALALHDVKASEEGALTVACYPAHVRMILAEAFATGTP